MSNASTMGSSKMTLSPVLKKDSAKIPLVRQYLRIALRWRFVILGAIVGCLLLGVIVTLLMTPKFTAVTTIEISRETNQMATIGDRQGEVNPNDQEFYQTQYGLLRADSLAERVAGSLQLADKPEFFEMFGHKMEGDAFVRVDNRFRPAGRPDRIRAAGSILLDHVSVSPTRLSRLVDIRVTTPDAELSAKIANAWTANFIQASLERRYQATSYARTFLEGRLEQLRRRLEESERQLVGYASNQRIINLPAQSGSDAGGRSIERSIVADDLAALNAALAQATAERIEAGARSQQGQGASAEALRDTTLSSLRERRATLAAEYQRLMTQFEPEYPSARAVQAQIQQIDRSIVREEARISSNVSGQYQASINREQALRTQVEQLKNNLLDQRRRSIQYNIFQRDVDTNRQLYDGLLQRYKEIGVAGGIGVNNVSIVDPAAVPDGPSSPRLLINMALALVAGLALGALIVFLLEQADETIADPADLERRFGLPLLGSVPRTSGGASPRDALLDRKSSLVDAYLAIQTNLGFTTEHGVPRSLAVTSTRPSEGKSTSALALATMLSRAQKRVILVDGDMRSPSVHHLAGVPNSAGLSNYLAGQDNVDDLIVPMSGFDFSVMLAGPIPPNAAELLTGGRLGILIERLLTQYDHVGIDSPPVMGLADAPLIASRVEGVAYVVESHGIRASLVQNGLSRLDIGGVHLLGGIITKLEPRKGHYGYDYGYSYGRDDGTTAIDSRS